MSFAANINAIALIDLFRDNSTLRELFVDLDFELLDEDMVSVLLKSSTYDCVIIDKGA